jgi:serine/threonine protein kinase
VVYKSTNKLGKKVALKIAKEYIRDMIGSLKETYLRESVIMGRLSHPNVIKYLDHFKSRR